MWNGFFIFQLADTVQLKPEHENWTFEFDLILVPTLTQMKSL